MSTCEEQILLSLSSPVIDCHSSRQTVGIRGAIQLSLIPLEPVIFLQGDGRLGGHSETKPAVTRGYLHLKVNQQTKIKSICVSFHGLARFQPLGESTRRQDLITSCITYFEDGNTTFLDRGHYPLYDKSIVATETGRYVKSPIPAVWEEQVSPPDYDPGSLYQSKILSDRHEIPRYFSHLKSNYSIFLAGDYIYPFEFLVHSSLPETISTELISIGYYLEAKVESPGIFRSKMRLKLEIPLLRLPPEHSLELIEPIIISKDWREQLHYDTCILGRSFPFGSGIPITLKLTPFMDLKCSWIKVYVSQNMQYWKTGREARLLQLGRRKVLLFEKQAGMEHKSTFPGSRFQITSDQGSIRLENIQTPSLLGKVLETRQIDLDVQLPRCHELKERPQWQRLQTSAKSGKLEVNHWIQIVLCLSKMDKTATREPYAFQLLIIETPITVLSCKATSSNIYVPPYTNEPNMNPMPARNLQCDCVGSNFPKTLAPMHKADALTTEQSTSVDIILPNMTRSLNFDSSCSNVKPPAQVHIAG